MKHVIVTGGSGFIGTHVIDACLADGRTVVNFDIRPPEREEHRTLWRPVDLLDEESVRREIRDVPPSAIVNLAAEADISASGDAFAVNTHGLRNVLAANNDLASPALVIHASTQFVVKPRTSSDRAPGLRPVHGVRRDQGTIRTDHVG